MRAVILLLLCTGCGARTTSDTYAESLCGRFADETPDPVTVRIENTGKAPLYIYDPDNGCSLPMYAALDAAGDEVWQLHDFMTCGALQREPFTVQLCIETSSSAFRINPGAHFETRWSATRFEITEMPEPCFASYSGENPCAREVAVAPGRYQIKAWAYWSDDWLSDGHTCEPVGEGVCRFDGWIQLGAKSERSRHIEYPLERSVVFDFAASP